MSSAVVTEISNLDVGTISMETDEHISELFKPQVKLVYGFLDG
jgi:hypothetical protein